MKVVNLTLGSNIYTSNAYLVTGSHNRLQDMNTLVDVGRDPVILKRIEAASTGVGKKRISQVVLTHSHYDHVNLLSEIKVRYQPEVWAYSKYLKGVDHVLSDGDTLRFGDRLFEIIHTPGHSDDSVCFYCREERVLFAGDTPLIIHSSGSYSREFILALRKISLNPIDVIYFGHGLPLEGQCQHRILQSIDNINTLKYKLKVR